MRSSFGRVKKVMQGAMGSLMKRQRSEEGIAGVQGLLLLDHFLGVSDNAV